MTRSRSDRVFARRAKTPFDPVLPPFDPAKVRPIEYEDDVRRLLAAHEAKRRKPK